MNLTARQHQIVKFIYRYRKRKGLAPTLAEIASDLGISKVTVHEHISQLEKKGALEKEPYLSRSTKLTRRMLRELEKTLLEASRYVGYEDPDGLGDLDGDADGLDGNGNGLGALDHDDDDAVLERDDDDGDAGETTPSAAAYLGGYAHGANGRSGSNGSTGSNGHARLERDGDDDARFTAEGVCLPLLGEIAAGRPLEAVESSERVDIAEVCQAHRAHYMLRVRGDSMIEDGICDGDYVLVEKRHNAVDGETVVAVLPGEEATLKRFFRFRKKFKLEPANAALKPIIVDNVEVRGVVVGVLRSY